MPAPPVPDIAAGNAAFSTAMRAFHAWEAGELQAALNAYEATRLLSTTTTSVTSNTIGTGDKTFTVGAGLGFVAGQSVNVANTANPANYMSGIVKSYSSTTLVVTVLTTGGSGTLSAWSIALGLSGGGASLGANTFVGVQNFAQGADIASAATINLTAATGNTLTVTGTVATSVVTLGAGQTRLVRAAAAWPLTYNATTNNITGGVSTTLAAGDMVFYQNISGVVYGLIIKQSGRAVIETDKIQSISASIAANAITVSASALTLDFRSETLTSGIISTVSGTPASLVIASTDSFGLTTAFGNQRLAILAINNAGTIELAASALYGGVNLDETGTITTAATSTTAAGIKANAARTTKAYRVIGFIDATFTTAVGWGSLAIIQGYGGQAFSAMSSLGYGQTWQDLTGSRALSTTYYNTTGRPIMVLISLSIGAGAGAATVNGVAIGSTDVATGTVTPISFIVPTGASYSYANDAISKWAELR
jgi:hypothetical protein